MPSLSPEYWDAVAAGDDTTPDGWRRYGRDQHLALLERWVGAPRGRWLKTDLFEERSPHRAMVPHLGPAAWVGVDLSIEVLRASRGLGPPALAVSDVRRLPFRRASFDGILSTSTLDHFEEVASIEVALRELLRLLRPGGALVLTLDNPFNPLMAAHKALPERISRRTGLMPFAVGRTLSRRRGVEMLERVGFSVTDTTYVLHPPHVVSSRPARHPWWERRVLPVLGGLGRTPLAPFTGHYVAFLATPR